jgi:hypothetical protein
MGGQHGVGSFTQKDCQNKIQGPVYRIYALEEVGSAIVLEINSIELPDRKPENEVPCWKRINS